MLCECLRNWPHAATASLHRQSLYSEQTICIYYVGYKIQFHEKINAKRKCITNNQFSIGLNLAKFTS